jgi:hypothetical protein
MPVRGTSFPRSLVSTITNERSQIGQVGSCARVHRRLLRVDRRCAVADSACVFARMDVRVNVESRSSAPWRTICGRRRRRRLDVHGARQTDAHGSSDDAALKTVGEPCESRGTAGSLGCCAQCGEAAVAGRRRIDWTGEVRNDRLSETNFIRKPISTVRGTTEPSSAVDPRNRARRNFGKCLTPRTKIRPWVPRRTISS